jgi:endonuclease-3
MARTKERGPANAAPVGETVKVLRRVYPRAECSLSFDSPFQLLAATILSAQCTDARVNAVTPELFSRFPTPRDMAAAPPGSLEELVRSTGFFNAKARSLRGAARAIEEKHGGEVPRTMEALNALPGVGRKTANVVLGNAFGAPDGVVVDTHVGRLARRLGWSRATDPEKVERELNALVPHRLWTWIAHALILHGRAACTARSPRCDACPLERLCPKAGVPARAGASAGAGTSPRTGPRKRRTT